MTFKNYTVTEERESADLNSRAYLLRHDRTGARIFVLSNDDNNKVFYIGFRTPASDNTGVAHIMEHSVLCGSEKFPLKDPFVELVKGSMNTFLNAMTYPDKTVYPVASTNDRDFANLMDVYLDAVFHPNIYRYPEIMQQEGWNYSINNASDPIEYNGVVYNEMKGAFSSAETVLERETLHAMFPDTSYAFESGGDPRFIPELSYERFLDFHRKYYHPSNSYIYLYGDMDIEERLSWLDREYLSAYDRLDIDSKVGDQKPFDRMVHVEKPYAVSEEEGTENNTYLSYNIHCGDNLDPAKYYALQMIQYALVDTQGAPIRQRLLDEGIGKDIMSGLETGLKQEYFTIIAKNAEKSQADRFLEIINEEFGKAVSRGINKRSLTASLNSIEFKYKEADFGGYPKGLVYGLNALDSWLYDDEQPLLHIECSDTFRFLREMIETDYYEKLTEKWLKDSENSALVILVPEKGLANETEKKTAEKLAELKKNLSDEEISKMIAGSAHLAAYQEQEDTEEQKCTIPLLERSDISRKVSGFSNIEHTFSGIPVIHHDYFTNGIAYVSLFFDANSVPYEQLPYLSLLKSVISFVDTDNYDYSALNDEINIETGGLSMDMGIYADRKLNDDYSVLADLSFRALNSNLPSAMKLVSEVLFRGHYNDTKRLYEVISELKSKLQMTVNSSGHVVAAMRARSYFSGSETLKEKTNGLRFYEFIDRLESEFDELKEEIINNIKDVIRKIISPDNLLISYTGDSQGLELFGDTLADFSRELASFGSKTEAETVPVKDRRYTYELPEENINEGFGISSSVQYVARAGRYTENAADYTGAVKVFLTVMRYDYLWFNIRVQGGAYGCMASAAVNGDLCFVSYRDPNLKRTNEVYEGIPDYLENFDVSDREMTKYVIGTMSTVDMPLTPASKGLRDMNAYIMKYDIQEIRKTREEIIDCTAEDIRRLAPMVRRALDMNYICALGNEKKIEEDRDLFNSIETIFV
ncbi:MAG: insulinase family protein [Parasporobacterium sp.]|nr:insulinase family protein [Parasporobacterium sp.]